MEGTQQAASPVGRKESRQLQPPRKLLLLLGAAAGTADEAQQLVAQSS